MKKNKRVGYLVHELVTHPGVCYSSETFCDLFGIARSSLSEDITAVREVIEEIGTGTVETLRGAGGGIRYLPSLNFEGFHRLQEELMRRAEDPQRILGGGYLYTSDFMYDSELLRPMSLYFAGCFRHAEADYVVTVETKGIALASQVAFMLGLPLVIVRREAKYSEGSTVSINYFSGSYDRIQKMSLAKRAVRPGGRAIVIDDFMRGGGSSKGLAEILAEFEVEVIGTGVAIASKEPAKKKIASYIPILWLDAIDEERRIITTRPADYVDPTSLL